MATLHDRIRVARRAGSLSCKAYSTCSSFSTLLSLTWGQSKLKQGHINTADTGFPTNLVGMLEVELIFGPCKVCVPRF